MADLDTTLFSPANYGAEAAAAPDASLNLSNYNLKLVQFVHAKAQAEQEETLTVPFDLAIAT
jgi:hypothetical protein